MAVVSPIDKGTDTDSPAAALTVPREKETWAKDGTANSNVATKAIATVAVSRFHVRCELSIRRVFMMRSVRELCRCGYSLNLSIGERNTGS